MKKNTDYSWLWWALALLAGVLFCGQGNGASGPQYPGDQSYMENDEMQAERFEFDNHPDYDPGENYTPEPDDPYADCDENGCPWENEGSGPEDNSIGCNIKGNISIDTGEKIYHIPGQKYYNDTVIDPAYGERWFCTEAEARANGWRKAYQ